MPPNTEMKELLRVERINKSFRDRDVLKNVSFTVHTGEVLGLIGPNGAGKTTLFECLAGLIPANAETVRYHGQILSPLKRNAALFYLPDAIIPWAEQTVAWVLGFFEQMYGASASAFTEPLRLHEIKKSRIASLSKGERKRTLLALGLMTPHPLLMLDEPFDGLDLRQTRDVMDLLKQDAAKGRTLMLSIHQLVDAGRVCNRLVLLSDGDVVGEGTIPELQAKAGLSVGGVEEIFLALT